MSFSQRVKDELLVQNIEEVSAKVELIAAFKAIGILIFDSHGIIIELKTSQIKLVKRLLEILKHEYPKCDVQTLVSESRSFKGKIKQYILRVNNNVHDLLFDLQFIDNVETSFIVGLPDITNIFTTEEEKRIYVKTFFCCTGSINDPGNAQQYHVEISNNNISYLTGIQKILDDYNINMKITKRKNSYALYLNKSEEIADFLKFIKSFEMLFEFEDFRMTRDMKAMYNRLNNADIANEMKKLATSDLHLNAINTLKAHNIYSTLKDKTKEVCELRGQYPEESLSELSLKSNGELSKSTIKYHLNKVVELSKLYEDSDE